MGTSDSPWWKKKMNPPAVFGWDQLQRMLCRMRAQLKRPIIDTGDWGVVNWSELQVRVHTPTSFQAFGAQRMLGVEAKRAAIIFTCAEATTTVWVDTQGTPDTLNKFVATFGIPGQVLKIFPHEWGPLVQGEWWLNSSTVPLQARVLEFVRE